MAGKSTRVSREGAAAAVERPVRVIRALPLATERGIYRQAEAALFAGLRPTTVRRWLQLERGADSLAAVTERPLVSFLDLISLRAIAALRRAGVSLQRIRAGTYDMRKQLGIEHPLASESFLTDGLRRYFLENELPDSNPGPRCAAEDLVRDCLRDVQYGLVGRNCRLATSWEPPGIVLDPLRQHGAPCIAGSRVRVTVLHQYVEAGDSPEHLATLFELDLATLRQGLRWYEGLQRRAA